MVLKNKFFLLSFFPAIAYWILDAYYPVRVAVIGGLLLASIEIIAEKIFAKKVHTLSRFNFFLMLILGGFSLLGEDGMWFKLTPFFTGLAIGFFLLVQLAKTGKGLLFEMMNEMRPLEQFPIPQEILQKVFFTMEIHFAIFFILYAFLMGWAAAWGTSNQWIFLKTAGQYISFGVFSLIEMLLMRFRIQKEIRLLRQQEFKVKIAANKRF